MNIYYDPTDGVLMAPDNKGGYTVVQTNAQLDSSRISLSKEGYLTLFDFEGNPHTMCDGDNNPISLIGPAGKDGLKGQDGVSPKINLSEEGVLQIEDAHHTISVNIKGPKGDIGPQGIQGVQGLQGVQGEKGSDGQQGIPGKDGITFTPSISEDGIISWTNSGNVSNPQPISIKGPKGETGAQGPQGEKGEKGLDGQTPVFEISDGSLKYKMGDQEWTNLITDKSIFTQPDVQTVLPENPTHGQIILWEGNPSMGIDVRFTPGCKYKYVAAGHVMKNTRLIGKAPNSESYTVFKLSDSSLVPAFNLDSIKKEILTSENKVITLSGVYSKMSLEEGQTSLETLQSIYDDGKQDFMAQITDSVKVTELINANPTETHWAVVELEEVLESGTWIQIS